MFSPIKSNLWLIEHLKKAQQPLLVLSPVVAEQENIGKPGQRGCRFSFQHTGHRSRGAFNRMGEFLLRHVGLARVVNRIVPTEPVEGGSQRLTAMTAAHDVNVGHWNHHLDGDRNTTAAQRIKGVTS